MLRASALAVFLALAGSAWAEDALLDRCDDDQSSCLETCTLEFGTSYATRGKFMQCRRTCESKRKSCILARMDEVRREEARKPVDAGVPPKVAADAGAGARDDVPIFE